MKEDTNKNSSDSEDYDLDADLQEVQKSEVGGPENESESFPKSGAQPLPSPRTPHLKNNTSLVTAKLQGLLEKINTSTSQQPRTKDETLVKCDQNELADDSSRLYDKELEDELDEDECDEDDSDSDDDMKAQYRNEMFKQASSDFYKSQSTISFLRKFIYTDGKYMLSFITKYLTH